MATLEETLAAFGQAPQLPPMGAPPGPPDELQGTTLLDQALNTLQQFGAATPQYVPPPAPPPMPVGPAAEPIIPPQGLGPLQPTAQGGGAAAPIAQPAPQFTPPKPPGTLDEAGVQVSDAIGDVGQKAYSAADARAQAEASRGQAIAGVYDSSVKLREELQNATVVARQRANADADLETANWLQELQDQASREPNPARWWENQSRLSKALWAIGLVFGAAHVAQTPGAKNAAWDAVRQEMAADMEEQRVRLGKQLNALRAKGETMSARHQRVASDMRDDHTYGLTRIEALERAFMARATAPGDLDAQALKAEAQAAFAQMKLPYVDAFRKEKLAEKQAAEARRHDKQMQYARFAQETKEREAAQKFTTQRDAQKFQYDLALSPVSTSVGYTPGGPIPVDKNGVPVLSEMQAGEAAGLYLKQGGKDAGRAPRFRDFKDKVTASEVVSKANRRYTLVKELRDIIATLDPGVTDFAVGVTDPRMQARINQLGYEIAKEHDARVTNQDYSKGVAQGLGFDPSGNWLDRGKFVLSVPEMLKKLDEDLNSMPEKVASNFRDLNDAAINGQGTELVWKPNLLTGEKAPEARSSFEVRGEVPPPAAPVTGADDYRKRRQQALLDPEQKHNLPDHDTAPVDKFLADVTHRGPDHVRAMAAKTMADIEAKYQNLASRVAESAGVGGVGRKAAGAKTMSQQEVQAASEELARLQATGAIVSKVAEDATAKAEKTLTRVKEKLALMKTWPGFPLDEARVRQIAKEDGLGSDAAEIEKLIQLVKELEAKKNPTMKQRADALKKDFHPGE